MMSIAHRLTGLGLYAGMAGVAWWFYALAYDAPAFAMAQRFLATPLGSGVLVVFFWILLHHGLGGIRHLIWDTGKAMAPAHATILAWATLGASLLLSVLLVYKLLP